MIPRIVLVTAFVLVLNAGYAALQIWLLRRRQPWPKRIGLAVCLWSLLMSGLFLLEVFEPTAWKPFLRHWLYLPLAVEMIWNVLLLELLVLGMILLVLVIRRLRPISPARPLSPQGMSRRKFLYLLGCGAAPATALGLGVHGTLSRQDLRVRYLDVPIANLPPELEGFTIAHVSDLHSGVFCGPSRLKIIHAAANDLKADLVTITGDVINRDMGEFPAALAAIRNISSRHGTYLCEGNHDVIPGHGLVAGACAEHNLPMLGNTSVIVPVRGRRLIIGGLPWMRNGQNGGPKFVRRLYPAREEGDVRILLAHHPRLFDDAESADLVLSGHTHGGQIMFADEIGVGPLLFNYWSGLYQRGATSLVVSNGCGDWFPCRIGAPAEIGLLRLTKA